MLPLSQRSDFSLIPFGRKILPFGYIILHVYYFLAIFLNNITKGGIRKA